PGKDIDVYLRPLIEDLKVLWDRNQKFNKRAIVLWTINDFPARSSLSRSSREFNGQTDNRDPPKEFGRDEILAQIDRLPTCLTGKHSSFGGVKIKCNVLVEINWTKRSIFYELEYWYFLTLRHNLEIMHIENKCIGGHLEHFLMNEKSKDTVKARQDLQRLGIRSGLWLGQTKNRKCLKPQAAYSFTPENQKKFCQFIKGVKLPDGFGSCFKHKVTNNDTNITGLKSHDCHIMMQQALEGGPILPRWMFPFERYMKKLKGYVQNKAKPEGSIAEGCVAEEALTFSSHYFRDVTTKFNRLDRNVDPPPQCVSFRCFDRPEIDTYRSLFKSLFPNKDMKEEFPDWFGSSIRQHHVDNDKDLEVSITSELFALACRPTWTPILINSCVVDGVRHVVHSRDERRITQNSGICSPSHDEEMYYGQLQEILEFKYLLFKVMLFRIKWFDTRNQGRKVKRLVLRNNMTQIDTRVESLKDDQYILFFDGDVIVVEDDPDIIHFDNSSDLPLSTSLNDLDNATLHIDGQSTEVDALLDIIDVVDEDDDITDDEDALPHDLADSDFEDLINVDDDGVDKMSADVARSHGSNSGGEDRPLHTMYLAVAWVALLTEPNLGSRPAGRLNTRDKTRNLSLKEITNKKGPVPIQFELCDKQTVMPLGDHAAHWSSYIGEVIGRVPLYYPSWLNQRSERRRSLQTQFDLRPHMESHDWTEINASIQQHLQKAYSTNKDAFKAQHWVIDLTTGTYNVEKIRRVRPENITASEWDKYIQFWNDPRNISLATQNRQNRAKSTVISRQGSRSLARLQDEMRQSSTTQEYPSLIDTFFVAHTVKGEFLWDEDRRIYEEMRRLEATGTYTDDEINRLAGGGKQRGHISGVGRVLPARATASPSTPAHESTLNSLHKKVNFMMSLFKSDSKYSDMFSQFESGGASWSGGCGDDEEGADDQDDEDEDGDGDN
nr:hypothetical protein [Tanacetum cinerariifolium]